jgi:ferredoxin
MKPPREVDRPAYDITGPVERYEDFYARRPDLREWDDENRRLSSGAVRRRRQKDPVNERLSGSAKYGRAILATRAIVGDGALDSTPLGERIDVDPVAMASKIKAFAQYLGAGRVGITELNPSWVCTSYAHPYTAAEDYGAPVNLDYKYAICMAIPQDREMMANGFGAAMATETMWKYSLGALISVTVAHFIRSLGWPARALPPGNSPFLVVPTFVDAGIGEQGRCGHVVTKEYGNNFRPGAVATDMPLRTDQPVDFGLQDFCEKCYLCADACPPGAISREGKQVVRGVRRWHFDGDKCRRFWDSVGNS